MVLKVLESLVNKEEAKFHDTQKILDIECIKRLKPVELKN